MNSCSTDLPAETTVQAGLHGVLTEVHREKNYPCHSEVRGIYQKLKLILASLVDPSSRRDDKRGMILDCGLRPGFPLPCRQAGFRGQGCAVAKLVPCNHSNAEFGNRNIIFSTIRTSNQQRATSNRFHNADKLFNHLTL